MQPAAAHIDCLHLVRIGRFNGLKIAFADDKIIFDDFEAATESCGGSYKLIANQLINFVIAKLGRLNQLAVNSFQFNLFDVRS